MGRHPGKSVIIGYCEKRQANDINKDNMVDCLHHRKPLQNNQNEIERIGDKVQKRKKYSKGRDQDWENMMCKRIRYVGRIASTFR